MKLNQSLKRLLKDRRSISYLVVIVLFSLFIMFALSLSFNVLSLTAANTSKANLTIWDITDSTTMYSYPTCREEYPDLDYQCPSKGLSSYNIYFYANFTNKTSGAIIESTREDGNCSIRFDENLTGMFTGWWNMTYSSSAGQYQYNRSFKYKGDIPFEINCTNSTYGSVNASENAFISNTNPSIFAKNPGGKLPTRGITEDVIFYYDFSENCTDDDQNDIPSLTFNYLSGNTTLANFTFSTATGNLTVNISTNNDVGDGIKKIAFTCSDGGGIEDKAEMNFTTTAVNDAPRFINLNDTVNVTEGQFFNFTLQATDEEGNTPLNFNATFVNCTTASWSTRNSANCNLFNLTAYNSTAVIINFTPTNNDVGNYSIELNITDAGNTIQPYNATRIKTVIFTVINANNPPVITYACDNEKNAAEDTNFACWIIANDTDESYNLTFSSNVTWFTFNNSQKIFTSDISSNSSAQINFTANDSAIGVWYINISVNDTAGGTNSTVINFNVSNVNDSVTFGQVNSSFDAYALAEFNLEINASDDDLRIPAQGKSCDNGCYNESLSFERNISNLTYGIEGVNRTLFRIAKNTSAGVIGNTSFAYIRFTPSNDDAGNYTINITVRDANNNSIHSKVFNLTVFANTAPYWLSPLETSFTFNELNIGQTFTLNLSQNATDDDGDAITFTDDTSLFDITSSGSISVAASTANDSNVGNYLPTIILTDARGTINSSKTFTFRIKNVNETPILYTISDQTPNEDSNIIVNFSANDEDLDLSTSATDFYSENLVWSANSTTIWFNGANATTKLNFTRIDNKTASISFTPNRTDVGAHTINITVNDSTGKMDSQEFILTVSAINHAPSFTYTGSPMNITLNSSDNYTCIECVDINVSDVEDGDDSLPNANFSFVSNETWFKISNGTGKVNFTVKKSYVKENGWWINITLFDGGFGGVPNSNLTKSTLFNLTIYEYNVPPAIEKFAPTTDLQVSMAENSSINHLFQVIVSDENTHLPNNDAINVTWKIDGVINSSTLVANASSPSLNYYPNFTAETTNMSGRNISVWVYDSEDNLTIISWNVTVNHTNAPPQFTGIISNITMSGTSSVTVVCDLSSASGMCSYSGTEVSAGGYFSDADHSDAKYNQSINLSLGIMSSDCTVTKNSSSITVTLNRDTVKATFYTTSTVAECFNITAIDAENSTYNATSNKFIVNLTVNAPATTPVPVSSGGGGGGSTRKIPVALKIIVPEPMTMYTKDKMIVPISLLNNGSIDLYDISLTLSTLPPGLTAFLSKDKFEKLLINSKETIEMTILSNANTSATYEIIITGASKIPSYTDSASFFLNLIELGWKERIKAQEKIIFLQELLMGNPECLELQEVLNEAKREYENQNFTRSLELSEAAIQACKYAVASKGKTIEIKKKNKIQDYVLPAMEGLFVFLVLYLVYYYMQRRMLRRGR